MGILERHDILAWRYCQARDITPSTNCMHLHLHFQSHCNYQSFQMGIFHLIVPSLEWFWSVLIVITWFFLRYFPHDPSLDGGQYAVRHEMTTYWIGWTTWTLIKFLFVVGATETSSVTMVDDNSKPWEAAVDANGKGTLLGDSQHQIIATSEGNSSLHPVQIEERYSLAGYVPCFCTLSLDLM